MLSLLSFFSRIETFDRFGKDCIVAKIYQFTIKFNKPTSVSLSWMLLMAVKPMRRFYELSQIVYVLFLCCANSGNFIETCVITFRRFSLYDVTNRCLKRHTEGCPLELIAKQLSSPMLEPDEMFSAEVCETLSNYCAIFCECWSKPCPNISKKPIIL